MHTGGSSGEVYLVAETTNLEGKKVTFKVFEKEPILLTSKDKPLSLLVGKTEKTEIETTVSDGKAQIKVVINHKAEKAQKDWEKKLSPQEEEIEGWYFDSVNNQSVRMLPFDVRLTIEPKRYTPATQTIEHKSYLWLQVICKGEQRNFDIPFLKGNSFEVTNTSIIHIYHNGKISNTYLKDAKKVSYIYHDSNNNQHYLGISKIIKTKRHTKKNKLSTAKNDDILLVYAKDISSYSSGNVKFKFKTWNSSSGRWYINPFCFAGLLGAMIEEGIEDLGFNGFSIKSGNTAGGSSSHINGEKGDLRYLNTRNNGLRTILQDSTFDYDRQVKFNNALYKFGWGRSGKMYSENFNKKVKKAVVNPKTKKKEIKYVLQSTILPHTKHMKKTTGKSKYRHHHHLHLTGFDLSKVKK